MAPADTNAGDETNVTTSAVANRVEQATFIQGSFAKASKHGGLAAPPPNTSL